MKQKPRQTLKQGNETDAETETDTDTESNNETDPETNTGIDTESETLIPKRTLKKKHSNWHHQNQTSKQTG